MRSFEEIAVFARAQFGATAIERLPDGTWSRAVALAVDGDQLVLRVGGERADYELDRTAATWQRPGLPIPTVLEVGAALDGWYALSRRVPGIALDALDGSGWIAAIPSLVDAIVALRSVDPGTDAAGPLMQRDDAARAGHSWRDWLLDVATDPIDTRLGDWRTAMSAHPAVVQRYDATVAELEHLVGRCPELRHVVHTDLSGNTFVADGRVAGIFDWANAIVGDTAYDVAHLTFWAPWHPGCPEAELRHAAVAALGEDAGERIGIYELHVALEALRFNAAMGRSRMLSDVIDRMDQLAG